MRRAEIKRNTAETKIDLVLELDGTGKSDIETGCGFLNHMLTLLACHGRFDIYLRCEGDTVVDDHHTVEDVGICLGLALAKSLGEKRGITRYGQCILPMDETLVLSAVDISGRSCLCFDLQIPSMKIGSFDSELVEEFFLGLVRNCPMSLHIRKLAGTNSHHIAEGCFKSVARSLKQAVRIDPDYAEEIPSSKGVL